MSNVRGQLRQAQQDLIRRLQKNDANFEDVASLWRDHWNRKLPQNLDDIFLIEDTARAGRLHPANQVITVDYSVQDVVPWWQRSILLLGCFALAVSFWVIPIKIWIALLVATFASCLLSYFDYLRAIWPRVVCVTASGAILTAGLSSIVAKLTIGSGEKKLWWLEALYNDDQSEFFSGFLILTGLIGIICSFRFVR